MDRKQKFAQLKFLRDSMNHGSMILKGELNLEDLDNEDNEKMTA